MDADFRKIAFGYISAEAERAKDPGLITEGYIDYKGVNDEALDGEKFLFLGYKGAGKSSLGERLQLTLADRHDRFAKLLSLADFPFTPFSKLIRGDVEPEAKYPAAWSWILLIYLLESFAADEGGFHPNTPILMDAVRAFRQMGLSPDSNPASIVRTTSKNSFKLALPGQLSEFEWAGSEIRPAAEIPDFVDSLKTVIRGFRSTSKHYLIIDGLDDILTSREIQYKSLSALIFEVGRLNSEFTKHGVPAKIILLCRTDLFERIPGANKNKIRHDFSVEFDWYHDPNNPESSLLIHAAQIRASRSLGASAKLFDGLIPEFLNGERVAKQLLDMTRHTPRDFLQLLSHIQGFCPGSIVTADAFKSGLREYSIKYFLPEIQDELSGYAEPDEISHIITAFGRVRKRDLSFKELLDSSKTTKKPMTEERIHEICDNLFECSAIGSIQNKPGGTTFYSFKYRNRHSSFDEREKMMLHRGLWKALNLV
ncbi:hypothetical protein HJC03_31515 [Rhizobium sp. NLR4b]|uniref:P-loop ATPase, Sll1717 family n=1 Tax=unclassified Rhizobium TaxID=2613769 RepID=UPI001C83ADCF|nr:MULTISPECIES: hypothetical protein [unclassified Rhizobium]MBX5254853.1 hypothetical protein [Rhizobium sp. NLR4b]MBX5303624.1 hypothetical protein [Rhizobium sp. NLR12b]